MRRALHWLWPRGAMLLRAHGLRRARRAPRWTRSASDIDRSRSRLTTDRAAVASTTDGRRVRRATTLECTRSGPEGGTVTRARAGGARRESPRRFGRGYGGTARATTPWRSLSRPRAARDAHHRPARARCARSGERLQPTLSWTRGRRAPTSRSRPRTSLTITAPSSAADGKPRLGRASCADGDGRRRSARSRNSPSIRGVEHGI